MSDTYYFYRPGDKHALPHDPFNAIIAPRPIGWISSIDEQGKANLAPYSFFNGFNYQPPIIGFSSIGYKDSVANIAKTKAFCWNLVTMPLAQQMNQTCSSVSADVDEFELAGLEKSASKLIDVPQVAQAAVSMECRLSQIVQLQSASGKTCDSYLVLGEVVGVHIHKDYLKDGVFQTELAQIVLRAGGPADYFTVNPENKFQMQRPQ